MGLYFRKSVRVGPLRFNLSGSGIGVSCGIPGLRIGTGPRGNYISGGHGGIYYRAGLPTARPRSTPAVPSRSPDSSTQVLLDLTLGELKSVDSGVSMQMQDTSSQSLLDELNDKRKRSSVAPFVVFAGLITGTLLFLVSYSPIAIGLISGIFLVLTIIAGVRDTLKKTTVLLYNLDGDAMLAFGKLTSAFDRAAGSEKICARAISSDRSGSQVSRWGCCGSQNR